ncbi:MAG TPA: PHP domain-containing protein [Steroidobacteraceae bacterium]|jgi:predicted metal-dependent phosphoesterase TrpH|nr:PHP domain-containing protein [Steroidobacteraceae bacterium]
MDSPRETLVDFHTHSHYSDGVLPPAQLVERATARGVSLLALTDHDTTAGLPEARAACEAAAIRFVPGVELSATWRGQTIHIVGLDIDERHAGLRSHMADVLARRQSRLREMGERLEKRARLPGRELAARAAGCAAPTRLHLARLLVERGFARDSQQAFDRYLNRDTPGHVPANWPTFDEAMAVLRDSGAVAVLAHPHRYRASAGQLRELTAAFAQAGGKALEASMAGMSPNDAERIASLCRRFGLHASMGSDFHDPAVPWNPLGRWLKLAPGLEPVTLLLNPRA